MNFLCVEREARFYHIILFSLLWALEDEKKIWNKKFLDEEVEKSWLLNVFG